MDLRPALVADAAAIARIKVASWRHAYHEIIDAQTLDAMNIQNQISTITSYLDQGQWMVATNGQQIAGYVCWVDAQPISWRTALPEITSLYVDPQMIGQHVGQRLLMCAERQIAQAGYTRSALWALVDNLPALGFYHHQGWIHVDHEPTAWISRITRRQYPLQRLEKTLS